MKYSIEKNLNHYADGEWKEKNISKIPIMCKIIGDCSDYTNLSKTLFLSNALHEKGAQEIELITPFIPFMRQDHVDKGDTGAKYIRKLFKACGITSIRTLDIHSKMAIKILKIPTVNISATNILINKYIRDFGNIDTIIAPDEGASLRAKEAQNIFKNAKLYTASKIRKGSDVSITLHGTPKENANILIVDDMLSTGGTIAALYKILKKKNPKSIHIVITHGLFIGNIWKKFIDDPIVNVYTTDSHPNVKITAKKYKNIKVIKALPLCE